MASTLRLQQELPTGAGVWALSAYYSYGRLWGCGAGSCRSGASNTPILF